MLKPAISFIHLCDHLVRGSSVSRQDKSNDGVFTELDVSTIRNITRCKEYITIGYKLVLNKDNFNHSKIYPTISRLKIFKQSTKYNIC